MPELVKREAGPFMQCDLCSMPVSLDDEDRTAICNCTWLNWGLLCDACWKNSDFRYALEHPGDRAENDRLKLLGKFSRGQPLKDLLQENGSITLIVKCGKCNTLSFVDTAITDGGQIMSRQNCPACGAMVDEKGP